MSKQETTVISFKHSGNTGDIIYALAGIKSVCELLHAKANVYLWLGRKGHYYQGAVHPLKGLMLNKDMYNRLKPLLLSQPYINEVHTYQGQQIHVDLNVIRQRDIGMPYGSIDQWYTYVFPDMYHDSAQQWLLNIPSDAVAVKDKVILNRTERYQNPHIAYAPLRGRDDVFFVGTQHEYRLAQKEIKDLMYLEVPNFYELARAIKSCKFFIGNQSMCYGLAEAMKVPRILEVCSFAPNVIPSGPGPSMGFHDQFGFDWAVGEQDRLWNKKRAEQKTVESQSFSGNALEQYPLTSDEAYGQGTLSADVLNNTLVDEARLWNIRKWVIQTQSLPGAIAEVGVYKGGTALLIAQTSKNKMIYLFDTFEGMPAVSEHDTHHEGDFADTSMKYVWNMLKHNLGNEAGMISIIKGVFPESIPPNLLGYQTTTMFSFVHLDVDIYPSVKAGLQYFYPRISRGGILVVDDYNEPGCPGAKKAFDEFMANKPEKEFMDCYSQRAFIKL